MAPTERAISDQFLIGIERPGIGIDQDGHDGAREDDEDFGTGAEAEKDDDQRDEGDAGGGREGIDEDFERLAERADGAHQQAERHADENGDGIAAQIDGEAIEQGGA
ncbi:hypothetical protein N8D56_12200 [Devosia sp. A8/3-2]|nr:hypothetical protein N8D56_12200 [Devosia sp. A8/3-2]